MAIYFLILERICEVASTLSDNFQAPRATLILLDYFLDLGYNFHCIDWNSRHLL